MTELMTATIMLLTNACILVAGFAVLIARMWLVCDNPDCAKEDDPIIAQPME
jgi:hypothetical protein